MTGTVRRARGNGKIDRLLSRIGAATENDRGMEEFSSVSRGAVEKP
jgi:hypothetical protein